MNEEPIMDVAHLGHLEILTSRPEESLRFFVEVMGMTESGRNGDSVYPHARDDFQQYCLQLTERTRRRLQGSSARAASTRAAGEGLRPKAPGSAA